MSDEPSIHLLRELVLPDRYETLHEHLGPEVAQLLVDPGAGTKRNLRLVGRSVATRREGAFVPMLAPSGTGKTTLANNLQNFLPKDYASTVTYDGAVASSSLVHKVDELLGQRQEKRIIPINIDQRESSPPTAQELAELKRFLRSPRGAKTIVLWPETSATTAEGIAQNWRTVTGEPAIPLPLRVEGPSRDTWVQTAITTLRLSNKMIDDLQFVGVDPATYDPERYGSIGEYLKAISLDFVRRVQEFIDATDVPLQLYVVFISQSAAEGILAQLTTPGRFGFIDANAILEATSRSKIGRWWKQRRGLLTQALVRLDARALSLPPTGSIPALRHYGPDEIKQALDNLGIVSGGDAKVARAFGRTDLGRLLRGDTRSAAETRGTPSKTAEPAFELIAREYGFGGARDKSLNRTISKAIGGYLPRVSVPFESITAETGLPHLRIIPDIAVQGEEKVVCIEPTWRKGDFLTSTNRSSVAQYILQKIHNYCEQLGWIPELD